MIRMILLGAVRRLRRGVGSRFGRGAPVRRLAHRWFDHEAVDASSPTPYERADPGDPVDFLVSDGRGVPDPTDVFRRLRWGGQMLLVESELDVVMQGVRLYKAHDGFEVEAGPGDLPRGRFGLPLPWLGPVHRYMVVRKVTLIEPGEDTDRFTFDVRLIKKPEFGDRYVVMKQVPRYRRVVARLHSRFPEAGQEVLLARAEKLVKRVFPVFLTREAGFLQLLHRDLPDEFRGRVPEALGFEKAPDGTIKRLYMTWLRLGGEPLSHMQFSQEAAELLSVLHDKVGMIHLDLRLDNMVISDGRVCFLDFGSSVRVGEDIARSPLLSSLFSEMMNTSQIQRTMGKMRDAGRLTSDVIVSAQGKMDKAVDMFYLSLQISKPVSNPELLPFLKFDPAAPVAKRIKLLTDAILRPTNPNRPHFISAHDVFVGLQKIEKKLAEPGNGVGPTDSSGRGTHGGSGAAPGRGGR
ncbi:MAG: hypothetical protein AAF333_16810 [Planctomycetota bacterium]